MMLRKFTVLAVLLALAASASALKVSVWDRELQTKLGDGETTGSKFNVRLVTDYDGPVVVLFALSDDEKARGAFPGLKSRYNGSLQDGQLTLQTQAAAGTAASDRTLNGLQINTGTTLAKFLTAFKLSLNLQPAGQSLSLPGLNPQK